jgi:hypothetical protein
MEILTRRCYNVSKIKMLYHLVKGVFMFLDAMRNKVLLQVFYFKRNQDIDNAFNSEYNYDN